MPRKTYPNGRRNHTPGPVFDNLRGHLDALTARARGEAGYRADVLEPPTRPRAAGRRP